MQLAQAPLSCGAVPSCAPSAKRNTATGTDAPSPRRFVDQPIVNPELAVPVEGTLNESVIRRVPVLIHRTPATRRPGGVPRCASGADEKCSERKGCTSLRPPIRGALHKPSAQSRVALRDGGVRPSPRVPDFYPVLTGTDQVKAGDVPAIQIQAEAPRRGSRSSPRRGSDGRC